MNSGKLTVWSEILSNLYSEYAKVLGNLNFMPNLEKYARSGFVLGTLDTLP
jgi:hypothetical protein